MSLRLGAPSIHRQDSCTRAPKGDSAGWFKIPVGLAAALHAARISTPEVVAAAGLSTRQLEQPGAYVPPEQYYALWRAIRIVSADPHIGIALARSVRADITEPFFLAIMSAPDVAGAVDVVARFRRMLDPYELVLSREGPSRLAMVYEWPMCSSAPPQALIEAELALFVEVCRRGTGREDFAPMEVQFAAKSLEDTALLAAYFRCPISVGADRNAMVFAASELALPFDTHNPEMLNALIPFLRANLPAAEEGIVRRVRSVLAARLRGRRPTVHAVAKELALSTRAMQRLLKESGTSFRALMDEVRNEHAKAYLADTQFTDGEIAFLLGFEDANSFYRAFRIWNAASPSTFRARRNGRGKSTGST
jgi:AraC-like DNA-binding protein